MDIQMPFLEVKEFLPIFISATLVIVFGAMYAGGITLAKMGFISKKWSFIAYLFWVLQTYSLYYMAIRIHSNVFTQKVLIITMVAYLFIPHLYFRLISDIDNRYEKKKDLTN
jgi:hypothetical protein